MKILELDVKEIRGVRQISLAPGGKNLVVFGPNGTGKSAIVDAVDFLLTGRISRLIGEGTRDLSLKEHGCHVDSRDKLKNTVVTAKVLLDGKEIVLERSISKPSTLKVNPAEHKALVESSLKVADLGQHILSRREILRYITAESGKRASEIQSLLDLGDIETVRKFLVSIKNRAVSEAERSRGNVAAAENEISALLGLAKFSSDGCLGKVNSLRAVLQGSPIVELSSEAVKKELKAQPFGERKDVLTVTEAENHIKQVRQLGAERDIHAVSETRLRELLEEIKKDVKLKKLSLYARLLPLGRQLVDESNACPLCERVWDKGDFGAYLDEKVKEAAAAGKKLAEIDGIAAGIRIQVVQLKNSLSNVDKACRQNSLKNVDDESWKKLLVACDVWSEAMLKPMETFDEGKWPVLGLKELFGVAYVETAILVPLEAALKKCGEGLSKQQEAWDTLTKMEDKWKTYKATFKNRLQADSFRERAESAVVHFLAARDDTLKAIYDQVKDTFDKHYRTIHSSDEAAFKSALSHEEAALKFEVDFYGRGMFPPHALHSEGHQDSMGLCLFLALNEYLTKSTISVIVLDDVIMSIDRDHRRGICRLLRESFPDRQFIMTTHDDVWARQLKTEGVVTGKNMVHFVNWNIDTGPVSELDKDLWKKIDEDLARGDVPSAAHKLRREAECSFENACDLLEASVPYRGDHQWTLGDLAPAAICALKNRARSGRVNFEKLKQKDKADAVKAFEEQIGKANGVFQVEQWATNTNVHYNKWAEFTKQDFMPVVEAFKDLFSLFSCKSCGSPISLKGVGNSKVASCGCGTIFWNLG